MDGSKKDTSDARHKYNKNKEELTQVLIECNQNIDWLFLLANNMRTAL